MIDDVISFGVRVGRSGEWGKRVGTGSSSGEGVDVLFIYKGREGAV